MTHGRDAPRRAVFVDKDGTLVEDVPYGVNPSSIRLTPGAGDAMAALARAGFLVVLVTNQSGVAHGRFQEAALAGVERRVRALLVAAGARLDGFYACPHAPDGSVPRYAIACACRKPAPGLLVRAARDLGVDLERSWMVGDILDDVEAGRAAGCRTVLLDVGHESEWSWSPERVPDVIAPDLGAAADHILNVEAVQPWSVVRPAPAGRPR